MSNKGKFIDNTPFIPFAGVTTALEGISSDNSIRQDLYFCPSTVTPDGIKKYRNSTRERIGIKQLHPGIFNDPKFYDDLTHGVKSPYSDHVKDCIKANNLTGNNFFLNQLKENHYASAKREPLGKGIIRDYKFPIQVTDKNFRFGIPTVGFYNAKEVIYNSNPLEESDEVKKLYQKTHGLSAPGEQLNRNYSWYVNPKEHRFGKAQVKELNGTKKSLTTDNLENPYPQTNIVGCRLENFRQATEDMLGKSKFKGTMPAKFAVDHTFGVKSKLGDAWNVGRCINGDETTVNEKTLAPDADLGRDTRYRQKLNNLRPIERDPNKVYGIPSIRRDLVKREIVSVCDMNNYGDEKDAYELLYPHPCAVRGVEDEDFDKLYEKEDIFEIMKKGKIDITEEEYNLIYEIGLKNYPNNERKMSINAFMSTMRNLKREYMKYRTVVKN